MNKYIIDGQLSDTILGIASVIYYEDQTIEASGSSELYEYGIYNSDILQRTPIVDDYIKHCDYAKCQMSKQTFFSEYIKPYGLELFMDNMYNCKNDHIDYYQDNNNITIPFSNHIDKLSSSYTYYDIYQGDLDTGMMYEKSEYIIIFKKIGG
jgi:hypothetical protein